MSTADGAGSATAAEGDHFGGGDACAGMTRLEFGLECRLQLETVFLPTGKNRLELAHVRLTTQNIPSLFWNDRNLRCDRRRLDNEQLERFDDASS